MLVVPALLVGAISMASLVTATPSRRRRAVLVTTPLQADTPWQPEDFTPVALLATDDLVLVVNSSSDIQNIDDFIASAKASPMNIGGTGTVNVDFIVPTLFAQKAGFEFDYVSFNSMADQTTALLSNALDAMVGNPGEIIGLIDSGDLRPLVFSGQVTPSVLKGVPTMGEVGFDIGVSMPRGLILAPDAPAEAQEWWIATMKKVVETPEWASYIANKYSDSNGHLWRRFPYILGQHEEWFPGSFAVGWCDRLKVLVP